MKIGKLVTEWKMDTSAFINGCENARQKAVDLIRAMEDAKLRAVIDTLTEQQTQMIVRDADLNDMRSGSMLDMLNRSAGITTRLRSGDTK